MLPISIVLAINGTIGLCSVVIPCKFVVDATVRAPVLDKLPPTVTASANATVPVVPLTLIEFVVCPLTLA